ncbi:MAG: hypothetical protein ACYS3N_18515 [Planctomycetota bacterium]
MRESKPAWSCILKVITTKELIEIRCRGARTGGSILLEVFFEKIDFSISSRKRNFGLILLGFGQFYLISFQWLFEKTVIMKGIRR